MSREHVFADWVHRLFGSSPDGQGETIDAAGVMQTWNGGLFSDVLQVVCEPCNNGWMSVLEQDVSQLLGPMMLNGWTTGLPPRFQEKLAAWAIKTALIADHLHGGRQIVPDSEYSGFVGAKQPLQSHLVWVAHRATFDDGTGRNLVGQIVKEAMATVTIPGGADPVEAAARFHEWSTNGMGGYWFTMTCGHFVCQVMGHTFPVRMQIDIDGGGPNAAILPIWPVLGPLNWPPPVPIEAIGGLEALHNAFRQRAGGTTASSSGEVQGKP